MRVFVFGTVRGELPELIQEYLTEMVESGTEILVFGGTEVARAVKAFLLNAEVTVYTSTMEAMKACDKAVALWDLRVSETGYCIDTLQGMGKYVRIYDMIRKQWC